MRKKLHLLLLLALCLCLLGCGAGGYVPEPDADSLTEVRPNGVTRYSVAGSDGTISIVPPRGWKTLLCPGGTSDGFGLQYGFLITPPGEKGGYLMVGRGSMYFCAQGYTEKNLTVAGVPSNIIVTHEYQKGKGWRYLSIGNGNFLKAEFKSTSSTIPFWSRETSDQALKMLDSLTFVPAANAPVQWKSIPYTRDDAQKLLGNALLDSSMVIEGTLVSRETQPRDPQDMGPGYYEAYTFEDLKVITGRYEETRYTLRVFRGLVEHNWNNYEIGGRYILPVRFWGTVFTPEEKVYSTNPGFVCRLNDKDPEIIERINVQGFPMESMMGSRSELLRFIKKTIGIQPDHYRENDRYVHSDVIGEIVQGSPIVARVLADPEQKGNLGDDLVSETFFCRVLNVYKGSFQADAGAYVRIRVPRGGMEAGTEYLVCLDNGTEMYDGSLRFPINAKQNAVIPVQDSSRAQQVYAALGIDTERYGSFFVPASERSAVERDTDTENVLAQYGSVDFTHLVRVYEMGQYAPEDVSIKKGLLFQKEYAAPILDADGRVLGFAHLARSSPEGKYTVSRFFARVDFMERFYRLDPEPGTEMYYVNNRVLWDIAILVEMENREKYVSLLQTESRDIYGLEILNKIRNLAP